MSSRCLNRIWPLTPKEKATVKIFCAQKTLQKKSALKLSDLTQVILSLAKHLTPGLLTSSLISYLQGKANNFHFSQMGSTLLQLTPCTHCVQP